MAISLIPPWALQLAGKIGWFCLALVAIAKALDFLLSDNQKDRLKKVTEDIWLWLAAREEAAKNAIREPDAPEEAGARAKGIKMFVLGVHGILCIEIALSIQDGPGEILTLGFPRIFPWQAAVDLGAMAISALIIFPIIQTRLIRWLTQKDTFWSFAWRTTIVIVVTFLSFAALQLFERAAIPHLPVINSLPPKLFALSGISGDAYHSALEVVDLVQHIQIDSRSLAVLLIIHALTAILAAPLIVLSLLEFGFVATAGVVIIVGGTSRLLLLGAQFLLFRIATYPNGPLAAIAVILGGCAWLLGYSAEAPP
jgi:hypothetical protein